MKAEKTYSTSIKEKARRCLKGSGADKRPALNNQVQQLQPIPQTYSQLHAQPAFWTGIVAYPAF
eukprot:1158502-Pelagomonas_calceolata.AAC.12